MTPSAKSLRKIVEILENFYHLSGLKISVTKTKAIWFGSNSNSNNKLCPELQLQWDKNFKLLGIRFDNNLNTMESNFYDKIEEIEKMLASWLYRYITPYGKVTIIKSLALSKLSHVALVIPNPSKQMFKQIETLIFKFLWNNKSEKVSREHAKLPEKLGGLNVPDIEKFWLSFKFSWFRRILSTTAIWPNILMSKLSSIYNQPLNPSQLLQLGPAMLHNMSKKLTNKFWQQVLMSAQKIAEGAIFTFPEKVGSSSFWHNPIIKRNNRVLAPTNFPVIAGSVSTISDFFHPCTNQIMDKNEFCNKYNLQVSENDYIEMRFIIKLALQKLKLPLHKVAHAIQPSKPLLIDIALGTSKGCSFYYKIIRNFKNISTNMAKREQKWHTELNTQFSITFWERARKLCASINFENPLKWLQFQIIRNSLQTNLIVSHFVRNVNSQCYYCQIDPETISHLYWFCRIVKNFICEICVFICNSGIDFNPTRNEFLFGYLDKDYNTPKNYLTLWMKKFIWKCKFKEDKSLSVTGFKNYLLLVLSDLKKIYEKNNKPAKFVDWNDLYMLLEPPTVEDHDQDGLQLQPEAP